MILGVRGGNCNKYLSSKFDFHLWASLPDLWALFVKLPTKRGCSVYEKGCLQGALWAPQSSQMRQQSSKEQWPYLSSNPWAWVSITQGLRVLVYNLKVLNTSSKVSPQDLTLYAFNIRGDFTLRFSTAFHLHQSGAGEDEQSLAPLGGA